MARYMEFANLAQSPDQEIEQFMNDNGPLGLTDWYYLPPLSGLPSRGDIEDGYFVRKPYPCFGHLQSLRMVPADFPEDGQPIQDEPLKIREELQETIESTRREADFMYLHIQLHEALIRSMGAEEHEFGPGFPTVLTSLYNLGLIDNPSKEGWEDLPPAETITFLSSLANDSWERLINDAILPHLSWKVRGVNGNLEIVAKSNCLLAELWHEFAQDIIQKKVPRICLFCGNMFLSSPRQKYCRKQHEEAAKSRRHRERRGATTQRGRPPGQRASDRSG